MVDGKPIRGKVRTDPFAGSAVPKIPRGHSQGHNPDRCRMPGPDPQTKKRTGYVRSVGGAACRLVTAGNLQLAVSDAVSQLSVVRHSPMEPIDRPFRSTRDFCIVWIMLAVPVFFLARKWDSLNAVWSTCILTVLLSLFATFFIYGPVLLRRQIIRSGSRGWFVVRVAITIVLVVALFLFGFSILGHSGDIPFWLVAIVSTVATFYLHWRTDGRRR
jgi:hypothetical protein